MPELPEVEVVRAGLEPAVSGARIVAETFHRAMQGSTFSIVRSKNFVPDLGRGSTFEMTDLLFFAFGGTRAGLAPVG